jgi:DNA-binding NarL/FixJ family response regulator
MDEADMTRSILIIEPHPAVRESFSFLVGPMQDLEVCGTAGSLDTAETLLNTLSPDIVLLGLISGDTAPVRTLRARCPGAKILVAAAFQTGLTVDDAHAAGADACVSRSHGAPALLPTLRKFIFNASTSSSLASVTPTSEPDVTARPTPKRSVADSGILERRLGYLSDVDRSVFEALGRGRTTEQIARRLGVSIREIGQRRWVIMSTLGMNTEAELRRQAVRWQHARRSRSQSWESGRSRALGSRAE